MSNEKNLKKNKVGKSSDSNISTFINVSFIVGYPKSKMCHLE